MNTKFLRQLLDSAGDCIGAGFKRLAIEDMSREKFAAQAGMKESAKERIENLRAWAMEALAWKQQKLAETVL
jgi:hypothetical protein